MSILGQAWQINKQTVPALPISILGQAWQINKQTNNLFLFLHIYLHLYIFSSNLKQSEDNNNISFALFRKDLTKFNYLSLCIKEAMRLYPPVILVSRSLEQDTEIDGRILKAGTQIDIHIYSVHHHPDYWDKPDVSLLNTSEVGSDMLLVSVVLFHLNVNVNVKADICRKYIVDVIKI